MPRQTWPVWTLALLCGFGTGLAAQAGDWAPEDRAVIGDFTQINADETVVWRGFDLLATINTPRLLDLKVTDAAGKAVFVADTDSLAWKSSSVNEAIDIIDKDIKILVEENVPTAIIIKLRNELTNIDKISNRINTIIETSFMPAAYTIAQIAVIMAIAVLLFVELDPYYEGILLFGGVSFLLISLILLIRDMDNPFGGNVRVDLRIMSKLEIYLADK